MKKLVIFFALNICTTLISFGQDVESNRHMAQQQSNSHGLTGGGVILLIVLAWLFLRKSDSEIKYRCDSCKGLYSKEKWNRRGSCPRCGSDFHTQVK